MFKRLVSSVCLVSVASLATLPASAAAPKEPSQLQLANVLGFRLMIGTFALANGETDYARDMLGKAVVIAHALGVTLPPLPEMKGDVAERSATAVFYLMKSTDPLEAAIAQKLGAQARASFKLPIHIGLLSKLGAKDKTGKLLLENVVKTAVEAGIPADMVRPFAVKAASFPPTLAADSMDFYKACDDYLARVGDGRGQ